jgi:hypothetical protein
MSVSQWDLIEIGLARLRELEQWDLIEIGLARLDAARRAADADGQATTRLRDGTTGYYMRQGDDCWPAAIATVLQVPLEQVPDLRLDERVRSGEDPEEVSLSSWDTIEDWLRGRGLRMVVHRIVPAPRRRWIGVVPVQGDFQSHCLVMAGRELLFDPAEARWGTGGCYQAKHVGFGFSFARINQRGGQHAV